MAEVHTLPGATITPAAQAPKRKRRPPQTWRAKFAYEAGCEVSAIAQALLRELPDPDGDLVRALAMRLETLAAVITSAEDDSQRDVAAMLVGSALAGELIERIGRGGA